ncbi:hypothetical protein EVAR_99039_1 [Eumeta japonica]|uniref:Uncharacterized protein n=1 Tax=Eumeta variegata TaxID=151549 RepID=A0A4C1XYY2_EUMVA|nr:hypothetical protein EVAR_99039_1 [Eumeta japonica]
MKSSTARRDHKRFDEDRDLIKVLDYAKVMHSPPRQTIESVDIKIGNENRCCGWESLMKSVTLGNVTMSHRTREPAELRLSHSTMIGLPR